MKNTKKTTVAKQAKPVTKPVTPIAAPTGPRWSNDPGQFVGQKGNISRTGFLPTPSDAAMLIDDPAKMSNPRAIVVWNANVEQCNKLGLFAVSSPRGGTIKVVRKESVWEPLSNGVHALREMLKFIKSKNRKAIFPRSVAVPTATEIKAAEDKRMSLDAYRKPEPKPEAKKPEAKKAKSKAA